MKAGPNGLSGNVVTVLRFGGLRIVIFTDDHHPAHVHVFGDGEAKIDLGRLGDTPELVWAVRMNRRDIRVAMRAVTEQQALLLARWEEIHGRTD